MLSHFPKMYFMLFLLSSQTNDTSNLDLIWFSHFVFHWGSKAVSAIFPSPNLLTYLMCPRSFHMQLSLLLQCISRPFLWPTPPGESYSPLISSWILNLNYRLSLSPTSSNFLATGSFPLVLQTCYNISLKRNPDLISTSSHYTISVPFNSKIPSKSYS